MGDSVTLVGWIVLSAYTLISTLSMVLCLWAVKQIFGAVEILRDEELDDDETT